MKKISDCQRNSKEISDMHTILSALALYGAYKLYKVSNQPVKSRYSYVSKDKPECRIAY